MAAALKQSATATINISHCVQAWRFEPFEGARVASGCCVGPSGKPAPWRPRAWCGLPKSGVNLTALLR